MRLLPSAALARLGKLEVTARAAVAGSITGRHKSPYKGFSVEFAEHRQYVPGDDPRNLDWRAYGKCDRYYIKQYIEETNLRATVLVDASGSMGFAGDEAAKINGKPASKFVYAQHLAAVLTYLLIHQQDAVGMVTFDSALRRYMPARSRPSQIRLLLEELNRTEAGAETDLSTIFHDIAERIPRRGLVIIISDMFGELESIIKALQHFRYRKHQVMLLHVMAEEELTFPFEKWTNFRCLEQRALQQQLDPRAIRAAYLDRVGQFVRGLDLECGRMQIDYVPMNTKTPYDVALANYLVNRRA
ncbi:MAG: DUF58 domain-containing protein [Planctomycetes bacterium]|nr:DUF58 domain-containing protein [Planctomycetota bacterium]